MRHLAFALICIASLSVSAQVSPFQDPGKRFKMMMPSPKPQKRTWSHAEGSLIVKGEAYIASDSNCKVQVSHWQFYKGTPNEKISVFVQALERSFQMAAKSLLESKPHDLPIGKAQGSYETMSFGDTMTGLWVSVRAKGEVFTVSISGPKENFAAVEATYLNNFELLPH